MTFAHYILRLCSISVLLMCIAWSPTRAEAQSVADAALLSADEVLIAGSNRLVARGNVEAFFEGRRLFADEIIYDQDADKLIIPGPVRITDFSGEVTLADSANLDSKLENGILVGARYVLNKELQILSAQTDRIDGRYTVLRNVIATSCQICGDGPPIWQIRAQRAVHDREEQQIYYKNAQFRLVGIPLAYVPRLRIPDPALERATGFLIPKFVSNSELGFGLKTPYFIEIGDHSDLTATPFLTTTSRTLELRYRKQFYSSYTEFNGALSKDEVLPDTLRYYVTGYGAFSLGNAYVLSFDIEAASDAGYRSLYGYKGRDRLGSGVTLSRYKRDTALTFSLYNVETLRDNETNDTQPTLITDAIYERRFHPKRIGGNLNTKLEVHAHKRVSLADIQGRDMARLNMDATWTRYWSTTAGLRFGALANLGADSHAVRQDSTATGTTSELFPSAAVSLRYPLKATGQSGARFLIEPIAQIGWTQGQPSTLPIDESVSQELDEGNLLALSRFPAVDRRETGSVGAFGARWSRFHPESWSAGVTLGTIVRDQDDPSFTPSSGLSGLTSDLMISTHIQTQWGGSILARGLFEHSLEPVKAEARFAFSRGKLSLSGTYLQLKEDSAELRNSSVAEWSLNSTYKMNRHWTVSGNLQYDLRADRFATTGGKLSYANECISIGLGAQREFSRSTTLIPSTTYELAVSLNGFSPGASGKAARRTCRSN